MTTPEDWSDLPFFSDRYPQILTHLENESRPIFPPEEARFRALDLVPPERARVVILGQDPYHTPGKADGLAFSIPEGFGGRLDSLGNIFKEIETDTGTRRSRTDLSDWADQGVLLLNTALSVPQGSAKAHATLGWSDLTRQVIDRVSQQPTAFILWGNPAQSYAAHIRPGDHLTLSAPHPSPLSAYRGFFGSRPFSAVNQWLEARGQRQIQWGDPK